MNKIGILTFHRSINYGAYMQSLSLSHYLKETFPDCQVEIVDYESKIMRDIYKPKLCLSYLRHPIIFAEKTRQYRSFQKALQYLPLSDQYFAFDGEKDSFSEYISQNYDVVIVGSDAVFNWVKRGFPNPYLMRFPNVKKLSYAASAYGMPENYVTKEQRALFGDALKDFSFIGVRDCYTDNLVRKCCPEAQPEFNCDPTVFLDLDYVYSLLGHTQSSFREYIYKKYKLPKNKKLIGIMEHNPKVMQALRKKLGNSYCFVGLYRHIKGVDKYIGDVNPLEWSLIFGLFEMTITNFFHGTLLSLRNHTPVLSCDRTDFSKIHEGKIHDVLRRMDLLDCCFQGDYDVEAAACQAETILKNRQNYAEKIAANLCKLQESRETFTAALENCLKQE